MAIGRPGADELRMAGWGDVVAVAAGNVHTSPSTGRFHSVGLRKDVMVLAPVWNNNGQCNVHDWCDDVNIAGWRPAVAVITDWAARATGRRTEGACDVDVWPDFVAVAGDRSAGIYDTTAWRDGTTLATGSRQIVAVLADGRVVAAMDGSHEQCDVDGCRDVLGRGRSTHTLALRSEGTALAAWNSDDGQCDVVGRELGTR
ncbi:hypothetical protein [Sanguibacter inulinus]|uniref:hypothetical protein n=1 Tax=Sanguibacter inulinus TaxID=60922 RepID=UPI001C54F97D|nr:hypothetical protein [Sanguibacter inulinus]